jgi:hypothetical protein
MSQRQNLSFGEFLKDIRLIVTSPASRLALIQERGANWGSFLLLILPTYFAFSFVGGFYFAHEPFPGYSLILPLAVSVFVIMLKLFCIHICLRLLQWKFRPETPAGTFRGLTVVFGYTRIPAILAILMATLFFLFVPQEIGRLVFDFKAVGLSLMIGLGIALFLWNLILLVLALRTVYLMRDIQIVAGFILGSALMWIPAMGSSWLIASTHIEFADVQPILSTRLLRFIASAPASAVSSKVRIPVDVDRLAYRLRDPERFELVVFSSQRVKPADGVDAKVVVVGPNTGVEGSIHWQDSSLSVGRIIGLPGDRVELVQGKLSINGQSWSERYLSGDYRSDLSIPATTLGAAEYLILPENRRLIPEWKPDLIVNRSRIFGREIISRWPLGWWIFSPSAFLSPQPLPASQTP